MKKKVLFLSVILLVLSIVTGAIQAQSADEPVFTSVYDPVTPNEISEASHTLTLTGEGTGITEGTTITYTFSVGDTIEVVKPEHYNEDLIDDLIEGKPSFVNDINTLVYDSESEFSNKQCTQKLKFDWSGVTVKEPGIYRWEVSKSMVTVDPRGETATDTMKTTYLYLYAHDEEGELVADVMGFSNMADLFSDDEDKIAHKPELNDTFPASVADLGISKTVTGNQGSKDQYFCFTIQLTAPSVIEDKTYTFTGNFEESVPATPYNAYHPNDTYVEFKDTDSATAEIWLKDGQNVVIPGLPFGTSYTITESNNDDYDVKAEIIIDGEVTSEKEESEVSVESLQKDTTVAFTNTKTTEVPTGIELETGSALMGILAAMSLLGLLFIGRRREENGL